MKVNRKYKDRLFRIVFREKEDLLELYNAVNGSDYDNPEELEIMTLEDAISAVSRVLQWGERDAGADGTAPVRCLFYKRRE